MKKRMLLFMLMLLLTAGVTYGEYCYMKSQIKKVPLTVVCCVNREISIGEKVTSQDLVYKSMKTSDLNKGYILSKDKAIGKYASSKIPEGSVLLNQQLQEAVQLSMTLSNETILVTFEFDNVTSNAWNLRKGQLVQLLFCPDEGEQILYDEISVFAVYDKNVIVSRETQIREMKYITFEVEKEIGYDLVKRREDGRLEILIL